MTIIIIIIIIITTTIIIIIIINRERGKISLRDHAVEIIYTCMNAS